MSEKTSQHSFSALKWLNFFAADISNGVGPFLAIYLASNLHWTPGGVGIAIAATNLSLVIMQGPAGLIIDRTRDKRRVIIIASCIMGITGFIMPFFPKFGFIIGAQLLLGIAGSFYVPDLIALAAVLSAKGEFDQTISKNQSFDHAGNVMAAIFIGGVARFTNNRGIFYCLLVLAGLCTLSALSIRKNEVEKPITDKKAGEVQNELSLKDMFSNKAFVIFLLLTVIFYCSNGAMLPLVGQELARSRSQNSTLYMSACIVIAQLVMVPVAWFTGRNAAKNGRKRWIVIAFILLATRGILYTLTSKAAHLLALQVLDGMAAGIYMVVSIMIVYDLMGASGRSNFAQGLLAASLSLGSVLSNLLAGFVVDAAGFKTGFLVLSLLAVAALLLLWKAMPETLPKAENAV